MTGDTRAGWIRRRQIRGPLGVVGVLAVGCVTTGSPPSDVHPCHSASIRTMEDALPHHAIDWADTSSAGVRGAVYSPGGDPVVSAMVSLTPESEGPQQGIFADRGGRFEFPAVPPGRYWLRLAFPGFLEQTQELVLLPGRMDSLCLILRVDPVRPAEIGPATSREGSVRRPGTT